MQGVQRAYFVAPWTPTQLHGAMNFAVAAADAKLETVVAIYAMARATQSSVGRHPPELPD